MPRRIELVVRPEQRSVLLDRLKGMEGVAGIALLPGASLAPAGDVIRIDASNGAMLEILRLLEAQDMLRNSAATLVEPNALIVPAQYAAVISESNEAGWEEIAAQLRRDTNPGANYLMLMAASGALATRGLVSDGAKRLLVHRRGRA